MIPKVMKTVYSYLFPEVWEILWRVEEHVVLDMYRVTGRYSNVKDWLSPIFGECPLDYTVKDGIENIDLDNHETIMSRITEKYSEIIHPLKNFEHVAPGAGSSPLIFHLLAYLKGKGHNTINVLDGEYEGYGVYAFHLGMEVRKHKYFSGCFPDFKEEDTLWFISNPSARDGNIIDDVLIKNLCNKGAKVVLDLSYAGATHPHVYNVKHENIIAVLLSQSKPYGVFRFRMGGFLYTRKEVPSLYGNKWFKDPVRMLQSLKLIEDLGFHTLYRKYRPLQEEIISRINDEYGLNISVSDTLLLGYINPFMSGKILDPEKIVLIEPYKRGPGWYRFCLTPYFEEMVQ